MSHTSSNRSIFEHPFYRPLLAAGVIPGEEKIPEDLLQALAILVGRAAEVYVNPTECRGLAALVVLGMKMDAERASLCAALPKSTNSAIHSHTQNSPFEEAIRRVMAAKPAPKVSKKKKK